MGDWVSLSERLPTEADGDAQKCVLVWHELSGCLIYNVTNIAHNSYLTHWMRLPEGPGMTSSVTAIAATPLACGLGPGSALESHCDSIHSRTALRAPEGKALRETGFGGGRYEQGNGAAERDHEEVFRVLGRDAERGDAVPGEGVRAVSVQAVSDGESDFIRPPATVT
ncbi:MAG: hypothetical protein IKF99_13885, partial [Oscillospiraceae bacterium]|nr:hypothetical protein [Oscillospiraceae bacterium]